MLYTAEHAEVDSSTPDTGSTLSKRPTLREGTCWRQHQRHNGRCLPAEDVEVDIVAADTAPTLSSDDEDDAQDLLHLPVIIHRQEAAQPPKEGCVSLAL